MTNRYEPVAIIETITRMRDWAAGTSDDNYETRDRFIREAPEMLNQLLTDLAIRTQDVRAASQCQLCFEKEEIETERDQLKARVAELVRDLQILGEGCYVRKVHLEWPALEGRIKKACGEKLEKGSVNV